MTNEIFEHIIKLFVVFIIGVVLLGLGYFLEQMLFILLGGTIAGIALLSISVGIILEVVRSKY